MTDIPDAAELLETAREALLDELVPGLSREGRYTALMIANAMAIATREARHGAEVADREAGVLRALLGDAGSATPSSATLPALREAVRGAVRAGAFDDGAQAARVTDALLRVAADWVGISNPKALRDSSTNATVRPARGDRWN